MCDSVRYRLLHLLISTVISFKILKIILTLMIIIIIIIIIITYYLNEDLDPLEITEPQH